MAEIAVKNWKNETVRTLDVSDDVFNYPLKSHLIYEAVCAYRAGGRAGTHKTKNRSEVSGGTKKLWKQKHTGRARMGDSRTPLWRHGGTVFGPQPRDYSWAFPRRMRLNAIKSALAQKLRDGKVVCLEAMAVPSARTRELEKSVGQGLGVSGKVLLMSEVEDRNLALASRNNARLKLVPPLGVSIVDLLEYDTVVVSEGAFRKLQEVLTK